MSASTHPFISVTLVFVYVFAAANECDAQNSSRRQLEQTTPQPVARQANRVGEVKTKWTRVNPFANLRQDSVPEEDLSSEPELNPPSVDPDLGRDSGLDDRAQDLPRDSQEMEDDLKDSSLDDASLDDDFDLNDEDDDYEEPNTRPRIVEMDFGNWPGKPIQATRIDVRDVSAVTPKDRSYLLTNSLSANWAANRGGRKVFAWVAPNIQYQPLYFEDIALERYGETRGGLKQFAVSGFHFFKSAALLPYSMSIDHPYSCDHPLGFCRPGNRTDRVIQRHWFGVPR